MNGRPDPSAAAPHRVPRWAALAFVSLAVTAIVMDGSIVNVALPTLAEKMPSATNSGMQWVVDGYILSFAALLLGAGGASDRFGRRRVLLSGLVLFGATSLGASAAQTVDSLIAWRVMMGIGAAFIFPSTLAIVTELFPDPRERRNAIAVWAASSGIGVAMGPVAGGWLLGRFSWGSVFMVNLPLIVVAGAGVLCLVPESRDPSPHPADLPGNGLAAAGVLALVWGLIEGPARGWLSVPVLAALGGAAGLGVCFLTWESRVRFPVLDPAMFRNRDFSIGCVAISVAFFGLFGFVFMVTQYFQLIHGFDALEAGLRTLPFALFILVGSACASALLARTRPKTVAWMGLASMSAGFAWVTVNTASSEYSILVGQMAILGVGLGLVNTAGTGMIMNHAPEGKAGLASSLNDTTREIGGLLGVAVMGSAFNSAYRDAISTRFNGSGFPPEAVAVLKSSVGAAQGVLDQIAVVAGPAAAGVARHHVSEAFLGGFHLSAWIAAAAAAIGAGVIAVGRSARVADPSKPFAVCELRGPCTNPEA
jgi:EmrB/QacA subfamily drug resistance transporter